MIINLDPSRIILVQKNTEHINYNRHLTNNYSHAPIKFFLFSDFHLLKIFSVYLIHVITLGFISLNPLNGRHCDFLTTGYNRIYLNIPEKSTDSSILTFRIVIRCNHLTTPKPLLAITNGIV